MNTTYSRIVLHKLELNVHLGWPEAERSIKQAILVDIYLDFAQPPNACLSDDLIDTFSYETLCQVIEKQISAKHFRLIESLGHAMYHLVKSTVSDHLSVNICVTKKPPIINLTGGVSFWYGDDSGQTTA